jgi:hypothetical protein
MKLSKTLLSAIVVGIALQTAASCNKTSLLPWQKIKEAEKKKTEQKANPFPDGCPACGMG